MHRHQSDWLTDQLARLLPDAEPRRWVLERFAEAVELTHDANANAWVLSVRRDRRALRLVVGRILVFSVSPRGVFVAVHGRVRDTPAVALELDAMFESQPQVLGGWNPIGEVQAHWADLVDAWHEAISAAACAVQRSPYHKRWSEPLHRTIGARLERALPRPGYLDAAPDPRPGPPRGWKIAPESNARLWPTWRDGGYIAIGWPDLGDLSGADREEFDRRAESCRQQFGWTRQATKQVWTFCNEIQIGDLVAANDGTRAVVGLGRVTGDYEYDPSTPEHPHRRRVEWFDTRRHAVTQGGWRSTLIKLSPQLVDYLMGLQEPEASAFERVRGHLLAAGLYFPDEQLADYLLSLQTRRFVILTGISGTGKTKIAQTIAGCFPAERVEVRARQVPVDGVEQAVRPYSLTHRNLVLPVELTRQLDPPVRDESSGRSYYHVEYPGGAIDLTVYHPEHRDLFQMSFRRPFSDWFRETLEEGDVVVLEPFGVDGRMTGIRISLPGVERVERRIDNCAIVAVRPDWTDNRGLLGFYNPITERYRPTPFLRLLLEAAAECGRAEVEARDPQPFFVVLDEMNLARVEHYFSDFLSCMESGEPLHLHDDPRLEEGESDEALVIPRRLAVPDNVFFTGTVNVDETTYMFSPKVLDRAFTLEFDEVDLRGMSGAPAQVEGELRLEAFDGSLVVAQRPSAADWNALDELAPRLCERIIELNALLRAEHRHFGYRVANEMARFIGLAAAQAGDDPGTLETAFDLAVLHKVLPKLHGTQQELDALLATLFAFAIGESSDAATVDVLAWTVDDGRLVPRDERDEDVVELPDLALPRTAAKLWRMWRRLRQRGFTSFIEG